MIRVCDVKNSVCPPEIHHLIRWATPLSHRSTQSIMGNSQRLLAPNSLSDCRDTRTGQLDPLLYFRYKRKKREEENDQDFEGVLALCQLLTTEEMQRMERSPLQRNATKIESLQSLYYDFNRKSVTNMAICTLRHLSIPCGTSFMSEIQNSTIDDLMTSSGGGSGWVTHPSWNI